MPRLALLLAILLLASVPAPAFAQDTPFGPVPTPEPTVQPAPGTDDVSRRTLYLIAAGVLVVVVAIGYAISRDARRSLPPEEREALERERERERRDQEAAVPGQVSREARARARKQRSKAKIARESRKKNRPRR
ncbi:MAG: hypothetical protein AVDCRST_MAG30-1226 [uncultured Solirubrobacteraceae bacterium]|uniref:Uncharacterized protein n=1 Tax=uncultured Solirubrobacteraceae bacterium TaxID=1162706 RepID=A0A6J4S2N0_9ACTN|nr:MAG: hypothetical protein AVDCRST_MAG30-1226 [uncultured Solirubrobacteraceae bacterium]